MNELRRLDSLSPSITATYLCQGKMETGSLYMESHGEARKQIIRAALTRFAHFGVKKTTVQEIAKDAHVSIAALKTLFQNKTDIVAEAIMQIIQQEQKEVMHLLQRKTPILQKIYRWLEIQDRIRRTYSMPQILYANEFIYAGVPNDIIMLIKSNEIGQLSTLFQYGIDKGELSECPVQHISELFAEILHGVVILSSTKLSKLALNGSYLPDEILEKQKEITRIFVNGLRLPINRHGK